MACNVDKAYNNEKIDIFDDFASRVENMELELRSSCEHTKSMVRLVKEVGTQILNLF